MEYFEEIKKELENCYTIATKARRKGFDPEKDIEIKITSDVASRVEGIVGPKGIENIIRKMEQEGMNRENIAFEIVKQIASGEIYKGTEGERIEQAVRTGVAIITEGVLVAPTEGIAKVKIRENPDGSNYISVYYSGPIRSAGGTASALSVVLADIARKTVGIGDYRATDTEIERYVEEVNMYEARITHLQYKPKDEDIRTIIKNCPICVDGEPTEEVEVSVHKNLERVETNRIRGGVPLVICEGIASKAAKLLRYSKKQNLGWDWLEKIIKIKVTEDKIEIKPDDDYLTGLVAGRPVFSYPSSKGGFRLRYGKTRTNGIMAKSVHPAVMTLLDDFLAYGTQMKIERPGKGCVVTTCENIEAPVVRLINGDVVKVKNIETAKKINPEVEKILFLGDIVCSLGDFIKSNHPLLAPGYCEEWWSREIEGNGLEIPIIENAEKAFEFSKENNVPLHPGYTLFWDSIDIEKLKKLTEWMKKREGTKELKLPLPGEKEILEELLVEHSVKDGKVILDEENAYVLLASLGFLNGNKINPEEKDVLNALEKLSGVRIRAKGGTYIGTRMGRPEKAKERSMDGKPNVLFPTGSPKNRSLIKAYKNAKELDKGKMINLEIARFKCKNCSNISIYSKCEFCGSETGLDNICARCNAVVKGKTHCEAEIKNYDKRPINLTRIFEDAKKVNAGMLPEDIKGVKGLGNKKRIPERLEKGVLRAKYNVYVFRDGTSRFDATDVPLTHFIPKEIGITVEKARELGYKKDYLGNELKEEEQLVPLKVQDVILSDNGAGYFINVTKFLDDLLVNLYGMPAYYNVEKKGDLIGQLMVGLSPHTSAGVLCRVIGFTKAHVGYAHPYFHTAKRRNCFDGSTRIPVLENGSWKMMNIKELVENNLNGKTKRDGFGTEYAEVNGLKTISFDLKKKKFEIREIDAISKHSNSKKMIELKTKKGRKIQVTTDHPFPNRGERKTAEEAKELLSPHELDIPIPDSIKKELFGNAADEERFGECFVDKIISKKYYTRKDDHSYCLTVGPHHTVLANGIVSFQCDADEDSLMLLMDALLNFSRHYLSERRGGTMDTPIVLSTKLIPKEVDDEAFCMEIVENYPLEFYKACEENSAPYKVKIKKVEDVLGTEEEYGNLPFTLHSETIDEGNVKTSYINLDNIPEKIRHQFILEEKIKCVDEKDVARRLILSHFIPDLYGNLRSYSRQGFRCVNCNKVYRRVPLAGKCDKCGGNLTLTIHKGGIEKYLDISNNLCEKYELPLYLKQRLELIKKEISSIFEDEQVKQTGLSDFV